MSKTAQKTRGKIMVADDDTGILEAIQVMLEDEGYEVVVTIDGKTVQDMQEELPDLLLLDIWMSGMDGRDICEQLKKQPQTKHIPIIMISANKDTEKIARECGADDFLAKPFERAALLAKVEQYVKQEGVGAK